MIGEFPLHRSKLCRSNHIFEQKNENVYIFHFPASRITMFPFSELNFPFIIQQALVMDEELFSQKDHELMMLQNQIKALIQENEEHLESLKKAEETQRLQVFFLWYMLRISIVIHLSTV